MKKKSINQQESFEEWSDQVIESLDGIERAKSNPFLFTRIMAKLDAKEGNWEKAAYWISRPSFAVVATLLFLTINIFAAFKGEQEKKIVLAKSNTEQLLATEFSPEVQYTLFELNEDK